MKMCFKIIILLSFCFSWALSLDTLWTRRYDSGRDDKAYDLVVDKDGNIMVTGEVSVRSPCDWDYYTIKYASNGNIIWSRRYGSDFNDTPTCITMDRDGNILVGGFSQPSQNTRLGYLIVKYDQNGDTVWTFRYNSEVPAAPEDMEIDPSGCIILTGVVGSYPYNDFQTVKVDTNREVVWIRKYDGGYWDWAKGLAVDKEGNIFVTGVSKNVNKDEILLIKYNPNGDTIWTRRYGISKNVGGVGGDDVTLDSHENIIVVGSTGTEVVILKYAPNGDTLWSRRYSHGEISYFFSVITDTLDNIFIAGGTGRDEKHDYLILKYDKEGNLIWEERYGSKYDDWAMGIALGPSGNIVVTGQSYNEKGNSDYLTINYAPEMGVVEEKRSQNQVFRVLTNPSHSDIVVQYSITKGSGLVNLTIYDISGKLVRAISSSPNNRSGDVSIIWDGKDESGQKLPSGIYFIHLLAPDFQGVKKVVLIR